LNSVSASADEDITFFRIGTGSASGTYFPIGGLLANAISRPPGSRPCEKGGSCGVPGLIAVAESTQGSVENVDRVATGRLESGLAQADIAYWAYHGKGFYFAKGAVGHLRAIANLYPEKVHIVVRADSGIKSVADLAGKRVSLGEEESGTLVDAKIILKAWGLTPNDLDARFLKPGLSTDLLRKGALDGMFLVAGEPVPAIANLAKQVPVRLIPISGPEAAAIRAEYPFFAAATIETGAYSGVDGISTVSVGAQWVLSADLDNDLVYGITRALWHKNTRHLLDSGHPEGRKIRLETAFDGLAIPLHDGAARYYREMGLLQ